MAPLTCTIDGNAAAAVTFSAKSGVRSSELGEPAHASPHVRTAQKKRRSSQTSPSSLMTPLWPSQPPLFSTLLRNVYWLSNKASREGFSGDVAQCLIGYVPSLPRSLSSQSTKDVKGLNHWCCSSAVALWNMAEGFEGRASLFLKGFWRAGSSAVSLPTALLNTWHVALRTICTVRAEALSQ